MASVIIRATSRQLAGQGRATLIRRRNTGVVVQVDVLSASITPSTSVVAVNEWIYADLALPALTVRGGVTDGALSGGNLALPALMLSAATGANAALTLPKLTLAAVLSGPAISRAALTLPSLTLSSSVTTGGTVDAALSLPSLTLSSYGGGVADLALPALTVTGAVTSGGTIRAELSLPALGMSSTVEAEAYSRADLTLPALQMAPRMHAWLTLPSLTMHAVVNEIVAVTYEAYAINLTTGAVSHYTNYPFDNILRFGNSYYGISASGIYLIGGDLDLTAPIDAHIKTFATKLGSQNQKRVPYVYSSGRSDGGVIVGVTADEGATYEYESDWGEIVGSTNHRTTVGKGVKGVYYAFDVKNVNGGSLELDEISVHVAPTQRAI